MDIFGILMLAMLIIFVFERFDIVSKLNLTSDIQDLSKDSFGLLYLSFG